MSLTFTKPSLRGRNPRKTFKNRSVYILLTGNQNRFLHNSFDAKIVLNWRLQILSPIRCTVAQGISTSSEVKGFFFTFRKERSITTHGCCWSIRISEVDFLWESVDWERKECPLYALTGVCIKRVEFRKNVRAFPRQRKLSSGVRLDHVYQDGLLFWNFIEYH